MNDIKFPLGLSVAGHGLCLVLLILFLPAVRAPVPLPPAMGGVEVVFAPPPPQPDKSPVQAETRPPPIETPPVEAPTPDPPPDEPVAATEPPPPVPEAPAPIVEPPPPPIPEAPPRVIVSPVPQKPVVKHPPKPVVRHLEQPPPTPAFAPAQPAPTLTPAPAAPQQTAMAPTPVPAPIPSPEISPGYLGLLSAWLESHKHYPDSARQRGEEGRAVLHFDVDRNGHVLEFAVVKSSGYADLDAAIEDMMRGAALPPFPASMTQSRIPVSVTIRFSLTR